METYSSPDEEITGREDIIRFSDVKERIGKLKPWHVEYGDNPVSFASFATDAEAQQYVRDTGSAQPHVVVYSDELDERSALEGLMEDFRDGSAEPENSFAVRESYMTGYAMEQGDSLADVGQGSFLFSYVKWEELGEDLKNDMFNTEYRGSRYYIRS